MAFTENYSILVDLLFFWDPGKLTCGKHVPIYYPDTPTRFAILPCFGNQDDLQWFEAATTYVLYRMNAYEEGDEIVLDVYFQDKPDPAPMPRIQVNSWSA
jgi:carotenoid cleavage dioxygenase-like enzyme